MILLPLEMQWSNACNSVADSNKQKPLEVRLAEEAVRLREQARLLPRGRLRDQIEQKAIQIEAAYEVTELLRSPG